MTNIAKILVAKSLLAALLVAPAVASAQSADVSVTVGTLSDTNVFGRRDPNAGKITKGQTKQYPLTITNNGPSTALGVAIPTIPVVDANLKVTGISGCVLTAFTRPRTPPLTGNETVTDASDPRSYPCTVGAISDAVGTNTASVVVDVTWTAATVGCPTAVTLTASTFDVTTTTTDPVPANNTVSTTPTSDAYADLQVSLATDKTSGGPGTVYTLTGTVTNTGPCTAVAVTAIDRDGISDGKITNVANSTTGACAGDVDVLFAGCPIGDMAPGAVATFTSQYVVGSIAADELQRGTISNINAYSRGRSYFVNRPASGDGRTLDPNEADNAGSTLLITKQSVSSCSTGGIPGVLGLLALGLPLIRRRRK